MAIKTAACITNNIVVNTAVYDEETSQGWLNGIQPQYDKVLIVDSAGIGWEEYSEGKLRPVQPSEFHVWDEASSTWINNTPVEE